MGIIDRARDEELTRFVQEGQVAQDRQDQERQLALQRIQIVSERLQLVAERISEPFESLTTTPTGLPRYYVIGDIVIMVQSLFAAEDADPALPHLVRFAHAAYLIGIDSSRRLVRYKIGTLQLLNYEGIAYTITHAPPDHIFDVAAVKPYLP